MTSPKGEAVQSSHNPMGWFNHLPQEPGSYLWLDVDWGCWIVNACMVCKLSDYKEEWKSGLGKTVAGENGGSFVYQSASGMDLVLCWDLSAPYVHPEKGPQVACFCPMHAPPDEFFGPGLSAGQNPAREGRQLI